MNHKAVANSADQVNFSICANIKIALREGMVTGRHEELNSETAAWKIGGTLAISDSP